MNRKDLYCVFAPRRSGHHAIIKWLINGLDQEGFKSYHINDIAICSFPYHDCAVRSMIKEHKNDRWKKIHNRIDNLILNYEDKDLALLKDRPLINKKDDLGSFRKEYNIIVIRDPFNNIASKFKYCENTKNNKNNRVMWIDIIERWKIHAREAATITNYLNKKIIINYNKWFTSEKYRKRISSIFHFDGAAPMLSMSRSGRGSSFDQFKFDNEANKMCVLERWKEYQNNIGYILMINDSELVHLYKKLFNPIPGIEEILYI
ncbi:MAG: hypothetical protein ACOC56_04285 [Atribacterota bacterium]